VRGFHRGRVLSNLGRRLSPLCRVIIPFGDPRRRRDRGRGQGEERPGGRRAQRHPCGRGGRYFPGGGVALLRAIPGLENLKVENTDQKTGIDIVRKAIQAPARQIVDNAGADGAVVIGKLPEAKEYSYGYDAQTGEYGDLVALGIIDPTKVVRTALQDAASIAGLIVTTEATITEHPKKEAPAMPGGGMGGMGGMDY
jgi:chaperonin GroEL (HSP60 family)